MLRTAIFAMLPSRDFATLVRLLKVKERERKSVVWTARASTYLVGGVVILAVVILIGGGGGVGGGGGGRRGER